MIALSTEPFPSRVLLLCMFFVLSLVMKIEQDGPPVQGFLLILNSSFLLFYLSNSVALRLFCQDHRRWARRIIMSYLLSLPPQSPLQRAFSETSYIRSESSLADEASTGTVRHHLPHNVSAGSVVSLASLSTGSWRRRYENTPPRVSSRSLLDLIDERSMVTTSKKSSNYIPRRTSWGTEIPLAPCPVSRASPLPEREANVLVEPILHDQFQMLDTTPRDETESDVLARFDTTLEDLEEENVSDHDSEEQHVPDTGDEEIVSTSRPVPVPFKRWISTLRRRNVQRRKGLTPRVERWSLDDSDTDTPFKAEQSPCVSGSQHRKSSSLASSLGFVLGIKSASITLASTSVAPRSGKGGRASHLRSGNRSSGVSDARLSIDSAAPSLGMIMDEEAWLRSLQRRRILEELISSEESYVGDMKVLIGVSDNPALFTRYRLL